MKYFSIQCVEDAYKNVSNSTKDKFWGVLSILYSIDSEVSPNVPYSLNSNKLSTFLENTFRLSHKKNYTDSSSNYSVVFSQLWHIKASEYFLVGKPDILPIILWAYRQRGFESEFTAYQLFELFVNDFHLSKSLIEDIFKINFQSITIEYSDNLYDDETLLRLLGGDSTSDTTTIKMNKSFVVANAGDLSRGPFFQPLYASLNTLECLIIFPFAVKDYYNIGSKSKLLTTNKSINNQRQIIFYGAPGTGKSHTINEQTEGESVIRTTFHPDSDYSTFVGAYKPTTKEVELRDVSGHKIIEDRKVVTEDRIVYEFVSQAFLQAYIKAWGFYAENEDAPKKQFLIIEEINRGNCAQIFGDLFQLLDRNQWGFSDYPINADKDMKMQLEKAFKGISINNPSTINAYYKGRDVVQEVLNGEVLLLPNNLFIWATMNTSDQSLFPIDSAFKRRWDWQYMPIAQGRDEAGNELKWAINVNGKKYSWWSFIEKINAQIGETTQSEDKKLGFFFCKAKKEEISLETFVGKVVFYLWNDVFKDYGFEGSIFKDEDNSVLSFHKFYKADLKGNAIAQGDKVELFLNNLGVELIEGKQEEE